MLEEDGELREKREGIYQGSAISPILSNIYMMDFDRWMENKSVFYVRYSDDMILLGKNREELQKLLTEIRNHLSALGLTLNEDKVICTSLKKGVNFLGYYFSDEGKAVPQKAEQNLEERLETLWLCSPEMELKAKIKKASEIIGGWEQYFREERKVQNIFEYVVWIYSSKEITEEMMEQRKSFCNLYKDIAVYLAEIWKNMSREELELLEYEQYYQIWKDNTQSVNINFGRKELLKNYRQYMIAEKDSLATEMMQIYSDAGAYEKAAYWMEQRERIQTMKKDKEQYTTFFRNDLLEQRGEFDVPSPQKILSLFGGREDIYSEDSIGNGGRFYGMDSGALCESFL